MSIPKFEDVQTLVTGGAGFIGSHIVDALLDRGARVRVLDNFSTGRRENLRASMDRIELIEDDIRDLAVCQRASEGVRYVFHQAALGSVPKSIENPAEWIAVNVAGTANIFHAARDQGVERVIYASSSSVYGDSETLPKREGDEGTVLSPYALSKKFDEELASNFARCFQLQTVGLRYFNIYGPRQNPAGPYAAVIPKFFEACLKRKAPVIFGDGEQSRDFTFVGDAVLANLHAAGADASVCGRGYNIGAGAQTTVLELAQKIIAKTGANLSPVHRDPRAGDVRHSNADGSAARRALGFAPTVGLDDGLERLWTELQKNDGVF